MGKTKFFTNDDLLKEIRRDDLTVPELSEFMERYVKEAEAETHKENGWPGSTYSMSKNGVNALTRIWAREWPDLKVFSCCPGWCATNMAGDKAPRTAAQGAETPVWLAARDSDETGKFYREMEEDKDW